MKELSSSALRICSAATSHFAENGYAAASLSKIAESAGIRKASVYAHFSGKEELFKESYAISLREEISHVEKCFENDAAEGVCAGYTYCKSMKTRYASAPSFKFLLMGAYFQPVALKSFLDEKYRSYCAVLEIRFSRSFIANPLSAKMTRAEIAVFTQGYLGIADSLHVELLYTGGRLFNRRFSSMWKIFSDSAAYVSEKSARIKPPADV